MQEKPSGSSAGRELSVVIVLPGLGAGGTEHVVSLLANHWAETGAKVTLVTLEPPQSRAYYHLNRSISVVRLGMPPRKYSKLEASFHYVRRVGALRDAIRALKPDAVVSFLTRTNVLTLLAATGLDIPVVVSERNNPALQPFGPVWKWLRARLYPRSFGLVTMTRGALEYFPEHMRPRSWVIPNAVDLPDGWKNRRQGNQLTAVGRLTDQKGFDLLLQAFAKIAPQFPQWNLVIWGEGEDRARLESLRDGLKLKDRVKMPGITEKPGLWVEAADVFVLSSRYEGWGIVLLEAMAAGLPCVSFDCEWGPRDMINDGHDGILAARGNVDALAQALARVLGDAALRKKLATNAATTAQRYSRGRVLAGWDEVLFAVSGQIPEKQT